MDSTVIPNFVACADSGNAEADGGRGWDQLRLGLGDFLAHSESYEIEVASLEGYSWQVVSVHTGASIQLRSVEEIVFVDGSVILEASE